MTVESLAAERQRLLWLAVEIDQRLASVEAAQRIHAPKPGRPRLPLTMTGDEARAAHTAYNKKGDRSAWAVQGNREYQRAWRRARRAA